MSKPATVTLPVAPGVYGYLQIPRILSVLEWERLLTILAAMRPGLVLEYPQTITDEIAAWLEWEGLPCS